MMKLKSCPTCGSENIKRVRRNLTGTVRGQKYIVPKLEFFECPDCNEHMYDREAMKKIQAYSQSLAEKRRSRKVAETITGEIYARLRALAVGHAHSVCSAKACSPGGVP
jgi:YgiT-type zinc finger domain-containing protein